MKTEDIIVKYPKIFQYYEGNPGGVNWFGVPKGWLPIVDMLCGAIQRYCDSTESKPNPDYLEGSAYDPNNPMTHRYIQVPRKQVVCIQMKEKFAGLRFYTESHDETVQGMISLAEYICSNTCEVCETREGLGYTKGWITVRCRNCAEIDGKVWLSREEWREMHISRGQ